ncbi:MFS transporter [Crenobacter cavernae]|uniref:MFS transporter n=2 Tax=Crenobacter cavernae TaxID=2290923 RepID=A0A345Y2W5_9NEIS|nr:MFS transporter [Crenobacter cavernae]
MMPIPRPSPESSSRSVAAMSENSSPRGRLYPLILLCAGVEFFGVQAYAFGAHVLSAGLGLTPAEFALASTVYTFACIVAIFKHQWVTGRFGYRRYLLVSTAVYVGASIACAASTQLLVFCVARFLQGLGGGGLFLSSRLMCNLFLPPEKRLAGIMWMSHGILLVPVFAPLATAGLTEWLGWRALFGEMALLGALLWLSAWRALPKASTLPDADVSHSPAAALSFAVAIVALEMLLQGFRWLDVNAHELLFLFPLLAVLGLTFFFLGERRNPQPWLDPRVLNDRPFVVGGLLSFMFYLVIVEFQYAAPLLGRGLGMSWWAVGGLLTLFNLSAYASYWLFQKQSDPAGKLKGWMMGGVAAMGGGCLLLAFLPAEPRWLYALPIVLQSCFAAFVIIPLSIKMFRNMAGSFYSHGYRTRLIMGKVAASLAISVAALAIDKRLSVGMTLLEATQRQFLWLALICALFLWMIERQKTIE